MASDAEHLFICLWALCMGSQAIDRGAHPPEVSGVGAQSANLGAHQPGFRCVLRLLIWCSQSRGWGDGGARGHGWCGEFSKQPLSASIFSVSFWEIPPIQTFPHCPNKHLAHHTTQPASLPRILQQTLSPGFSHPGPRAGPRDLIVLKHSSYRLIFQCLLQFLVSDLHIWWDTVGCSAWWFIINTRMVACFLSL